jgi:hypothetical protein
MTAMVKGETHFMHTCIYLLARGASCIVCTSNPYTVYYFSTMTSMEATLELVVEELILSAASRWQTFIFRGIVSLFFGILFLVYPDDTLFTITRAFMIIDGLFCLLAVALLCSVAQRPRCFRLYYPYPVASFLA